MRTSSQGQVAMSNGQVVDRPTTHASLLRADDRFKRYGPMQRHSVRTLQVKEEDETLKQLKATLRKFLNVKHQGNVSDHYDDACDAIKGLEYSAKDVERLSIALVEFQDQFMFDYYAGFFLSALINNGKDDSYTIYTNHLEVKIGMIGYHNTKNITINGDVENQVCHGMESGTVIINGNADQNLGEYMHGGMLIINGNAGHNACGIIKGGSITINGDVSSLGGSIAPGGGSIFLNGNCPTIYLTRFNGVKVYHKGKLVFDGEKIVGEPIE